MPKDTWYTHTYRQRHTRIPSISCRTNWVQVQMLYFGEFHLLLNAFEFGPFPLVCVCVWSCRGMAATWHYINPPPFSPEPTMTGRIRLEFRHTHTQTFDCNLKCIAHSLWPSSILQTFHIQNAYSAIIDDITLSFEIIITCHWHKVIANCQTLSSRIFHLSAIVGQCPIDGPGIRSPPSRTKKTKKISDDALWILTIYLSSTNIYTHTNTFISSPSMRCPAVHHLRTVAVLCFHDTRRNHHHQWLHHAKLICERPQNANEIESIA